MAQDPKTQKSKPKKKRGGGKAFLLLIYGAACAVGGVYLDRNVLPQARVMLGEKAQTLSGMGMEQQIRGFVEQGDFSPSERQAALRDVERVYRAKNSGRLDDEQLLLLLKAELPFHRAVGRKMAPARVEMAQSFATYAAIAHDG